MASPVGSLCDGQCLPGTGRLRAIIRFALDNGWQPELRGGTFVLSEREHADRFTVPDFLLTDRLRTPKSTDPTIRVIRAYETRHRG